MFEIEPTSSRLERIFSRVSIRRRSQRARTNASSLQSQMLGTSDAIEFFNHCDEIAAKLPKEKVQLVEEC